jgi:hypothetical protein
MNLKYMKLREELTTVHAPSLPASMQSVSEGIYITGAARVVVQIKRGKEPIAKSKSKPHVWLVGTIRILDFMVACPTSDFSYEIQNVDPISLDLFNVQAKQ